MFMIGLVVLTLVGLGFSLALESKFTLATANQKLNQELSQNRAALEAMKQDLARTTRKYEELAPVRTEEAKSLTARRQALREMELKAASLGNRKPRLSASLSELKADFAKYRENYRQRVWYSAVGEKMESLATKDGKEYLKVVIIRVTPSGLEINHESGKARISRTDLDDTWESRFQWAPPAWADVTQR